MNTELDKLRAVAAAARRFTDLLGYYDMNAEEDRALTVLESALEAAGYGVTEEEVDAMFAQEARRFTELRDGFNDEEGY